LLADAHSILKHPDAVSISPGPHQTTLKSSWSSFSVQVPQFLLGALLPSFRKVVNGELLIMEFSTSKTTSASYAQTWVLGLIKCIKEKMTEVQNDVKLRQYKVGG